MRRRTAGAETCSRLSDWTQGSGPAERLAAHILRAEGFENVDPSHPLGGPDGLKDVVCKRGGFPWRAAAYFPRGRQRFNTLRRKFKHDLGASPSEGVAPQGFIFVTNQELSLGQRDELAGLASRQTELYHRERVASILDSARMYGVRLEFLDIEMTREEQLAFIAEVQVSAAQNQSILSAKFDSLVQKIEQALTDSAATPALPLADLREFSTLLMQIGAHPWNPIPPTLQVPLTELREYASLLTQIGAHPWGVAHPGLQVPVAELREYANILMQIGGHPLSPSSPKLQVPLDELHEYSNLLTQIRVQAFGPMPGGLHPSLAELREYVALLETAIRKVHEFGAASRGVGIST